MKHLFLTLLLVVALPVAATGAAAGQAADIPLGRVSMQNPAKLDAKSRSELAAVAARIKKKHTSGVILVKGDFPGAESAEEYLEKSVFMAREVEKYLNAVLLKKFQVFVTAVAYSGAKRSGKNSVEVSLYPHQLSLEEMESLRFVSSQASPSPVAVPVAASVEPVEEVIETTQPIATIENRGQLSAPLEDNYSKDKTTQQEPETHYSEDAVLANELVRKAKARAAERAKQRAAED